jgi:hypothetical protein
MDFRPFSPEKLDQYIASGITPTERAAAVAEREKRQAVGLRERIDLLVSEQAKMKVSVDRIHCIDVWILIAGAIAALAGVILLAVEIVKAFRRDK